MSENAAVKVCGCGAVWNDYESIVQDKEMTVIGYQANMGIPDKGFFLFNHEKCKTTLAVNVTNFYPMYKGVIYTEKKKGTNECKGYCLDKENFLDCTADCSLAHIRKILVKLKNRS